MTGVGMMDCKKALTETDGDMDKAVEWLREKGLAAAQKKAGRIAAEGMAYAAVIDGVGVSSRSTARPTSWQERAVRRLRQGRRCCRRQGEPRRSRRAVWPAPTATARPCSRSRTRRSSSSARTSRSAASPATTPASVPYVHAGGKIGVLVNLEVEGGIDATEIGKDIAMQIAALNPPFWDKSDVSEDVHRRGEEDPPGAGQWKIRRWPPSPSRSWRRSSWASIEQVLQGELPAAAAVRQGRRVSVEQYIAASPSSSAAPSSS